MADTGSVVFAAHDPMLVALSIVISIAGAYVTRGLAERSEESRGREWLMWLAAAAVGDGISTWSMHYTGKLALRLPVPLLFDWRLVVLSLWVSIAGSALSLWIIGRKPIRWPQVVAGGIALGGVGVSGLHFTAMAAMRLPGMHHRYSSPALVVLSIAMAIVIASTAVYLRGLLPPNGRVGRLRRHSIALLRGTTNPIMHYTAMAAVVFMYDARAATSRHHVSIVPLGAVAIIGVPAMVLGAGLLTSIIDGLQTQKARLDELFEQTPQPVALMTAGERIVRINREFTRMFGYAADEARGRRLTELIGGEVPPEVRQRPSGSGWEIRLSVEGIRRRKDGSELHVSLLRVPVSIPGGGVEVYAILSDITDRKKAEEELRTYPRRLIRMQEEIGKRIALELHDEIGQALTSVGIMLDVAPKLRREVAAERIADARTVLHDLTDRVRNLALDLRPAVLDDFGLVAALQWLLRRYSQQTNVSVDFQTTIEAERFPADAEIAVYRIVQEALTNVARHAQVSEATVRVAVAEGMLQVEIADRGVGFDPERVQFSVGVTGMRERAQVLGGRLTIVSAPGGGTRIAAELPI
jgi:PAS domain S-box-containing protein